MKNNLLVDYAKSKFPVTNFFCNLLDTKPPKWKTASDKERIEYLIKYYSAALFFKLGNSYHLFVSWATQYYPFSLLYRNKLFHYNNLKVRGFMINLEKIAKKAGVNVLVLSGGVDGDMTELIGYLDRRIKNRPDVITTLENALQKKYETIYVRDEGENVRILIPTATFKEIMSHKILL